MISPLFLFASNVLGLQKTSNAVLQPSPYFRLQQTLQLSPIPKIRQHNVPVLQLQKPSVHDLPLFLIPAASGPSSILVSCLAPSVFRNLSLSELLFCPKGICLKISFLRLSCPRLLHYQHINKLLQLLLLSDVFEDFTTFPV